VGDETVIESSWIDPDQFGKIFEAHFNALYLFCQRRVGRASAEDVAGEVFVRAFEQRRRYDLGRSSARPWLYGIALNIIRNEARRQDRQSRAVNRVASELYVSRCSLEENLIDQIGTRQELTDVIAALDGLKDAELEVLLLYVWERLSYEEIALVVDVPVGTVRSRIHHARRHLAALSQQRDDAELLTQRCKGSEHGPGSVHY
jgi:RNA polymerase sigma-70 factor (ECF subfamily)